MADSTGKTAAVFRPKRNWKPKRKDRNISRRKKRKRWWRRNKAKVKLGRKRRYKMLKHNSMFKGWRKKRQKERHKRRMRFGAEKKKPELPPSWFIFRDDVVEAGEPLDIDMGYIVDYDPDTEDLLIYDVDAETEKVVDLEAFLTHSEFLEEADLDNFELIMDQYYGGPEDDLDLVPDSEEAPRLEFEVDEEELKEELPQKVASRWLRTLIAKE